MKRTLASLSLSLLFGWFALPANVGYARTSTSHQPVPKLVFVTEKGYRLAVRGTGWMPRHRLVLALIQSQGSYGLELRADGKGTFVVGVNNINLCNGYSFFARDFSRHAARVRGPDLGCPVSTNPPVPRLTVLGGTRLNPAVTHVDVPRNKADSVVIKRADAIYLWEAGTTGPTYLPSAPNTFFFQIAQGKTPPRACAQVGCSSGFFWEWVGMKIGKTAITMNPSCSPRCEIPSYVVPIQIRRR